MLIFILNFISVLDILDFIPMFIQIAISEKIAFALEFAFPKPLFFL